MHAEAQREDVRDLFQTALEASGFLGIIDEQSGVARLQMGANLNKLGELLEAFADWSDDRRVSTTLRYLSVLRDSREAGELASIEPIEDGVVLLTAHGSKGLEWPVVVLSRCTERRWQGRSASSFDLQLPDDLVPEPPPPGDHAVDEERRLFYVASTRARDRLIYTWARSYPQPFERRDVHIVPHAGDVVPRRDPREGGPRRQHGRRARAAPNRYSSARAARHRRVGPRCLPALPAPLQLPAPVAPPRPYRRSQLVRNDDPRGPPLRRNAADGRRGGHPRHRRGDVAHRHGSSRMAPRAGTPTCARTATSNCAATWSRPAGRTR